MNTKGLIVVFVLILVAGCTSSHRNYSVKENYSTANAPFDSLIIHFNYGESAPDTIVEWALYKNGDLNYHIMELKNIIIKSLLEIFSQP